MATAIAFANPVTTFVTAFLDLREDRSKDKSFERCFALFDTVAGSGVPLHLFLSRSFEGLWLKREGRYANVHVEWLELEDLETYKAVVAAEAEGPIGLPAQRTSHHDTRNFMILMNAKAELVGMAAAAAAARTPQYAWLDFSIAHVFQDVPASLEMLRLLAHTRLRAPVLAFPGCWYRGAHFDNLFGGINWRFCGGFFIGDADSVVRFADLYRREWPHVLAEKRTLIWEVNTWHWLECTEGAAASAAGAPGLFKPTWFAADHNDSIIRVPPTLFSVVASLTTIPPRLASGDCRRAVDSLLAQVDTVYLSVPLAYERFPGWADADPAPWLAAEAYAGRVILCRPTIDQGPATKYLGGLTQIPAGAWIFVCDDDQEYQPGLVRRMLERGGGPRRLAILQNHFESIKGKTSGGLVHGYVGLLAPRAALEGLEAWPLPGAARFVDDQWMSVYCHRAGLPVLSSGIESYGEIFAVLEGGWHEKLGAAALSSLSNRDEKVAELAVAFGVRFLKGGVIEDAGAAT